MIKEKLNHTYGITLLRSIQGHSKESYFLKRLLFSCILSYPDQLKSNWLLSRKHFSTNEC